MNKKRESITQSFEIIAGPATLIVLAVVSVTLCYRLAAPSQHLIPRPLTFEANRGQFNADIHYAARAQDYLAGVSPRGLLFDFGDAHIRMNVASAPAGVLEAERPASTLSHYYGQQTITNVQHFQEVWYRNLAPGIDLRLRAHGTRLEYDYIVAPHASPESIRFRVDGADNVAISSEGDLIIHKGRHALVQKRPNCYVQRGRAEQAVAGRFKLAADGSIGFQIAAYDTRATLVIDPVVSYQATYVGGEKYDKIYDVSADSAGNVYLTGDTFSSRMDGFSATSTEGHKAYVAKLGADGSAYFTFFGADGDQSGRSLALLPNGGVVAVGESNRSWPSLSATLNGAWDAFIVVLDASGQLTSGRFLGGSGIDYGHGVTTDAQGRIYIAGETASTDFPTTPNAHSTNCTNTCLPGASADTRSNGFWSRLNATASTIEYSTYIGGSQRDKAHAIAVDSNGIVHVGGETNSSDFPIRNAVQPSLGGATDGFVARYQPDQFGDASLHSATYFGGSGVDAVTDVASNTSGRSLIVGETSSENLPLSANAPDRDCGVGPHQLCRETGMRDSFAAVLQNTPNASLILSSYLGGSGDDAAEALSATDNTGVWIAGETHSSDFPVTDNAPDRQCGKNGQCDDGKTDAFLTKIRLNPDGAAVFAFSTYFGGQEDDAGHAVAIRHPQSGGTNVYLAGRTLSPGLATPGAHDALCGNDGQCKSANNELAEDGFVTEYLNVTDGKIVAAPTTIVAPPHRGSSGGSVDFGLMGGALWLICFFRVKRLM